MDHDDARIDEALAALARPQPPADHVARVLARTSPDDAASAVRGHDLRGRAYLRPQWILPVAATVLAVLGAAWQVERQARGAFDDVFVPGASTRAPGLPTWGRPEEIVQPVLPPQAYWGMDPFREFATLRPGTRVTADAVPRPEPSTRPGGSPAGRLGASAAERALSARQTVADDELTWVPVPSGLPPIELVSITPARLVAPAAAPLEDITPAEIPLAPIVIAPLDDQERP
jgi:hypothetical protein